MKGRARAPRINVTIDRLVLKGFAKDHQPALVAAFEAELRRALARAEGPQSFGESRIQASVPPAAIATGTDAPPGRIGARAARRTAQSLRS